MASHRVTIEKDFLFIDVYFYKIIGNFNSSFVGSTIFDDKYGIKYITLYEENEYCKGMTIKNKPKDYFVFKIIDPQKFLLMRIEHGF